MKYLFSVLFLVSAFDLFSVRGEHERRRTGSIVYRRIQRKPVAHKKCPDVEYFEEQMSDVRADFRRLQGSLDQRCQATDYNRNRTNGLLNDVDDLHDRSNFHQAQIASLQDENKILRGEIGELRTTMRLLASLVRKGKGRARREKMKKIEEMLGMGEAAAVSPGSKKASEAKQKPKAQQKKARLDDSDDSDSDLFDEVS